MIQQYRQPHTRIVNGFNFPVQRAARADFGTRNVLTHFAGNITGDKIWRTGRQPGGQRCQFQRVIRTRLNALTATYAGAGECLLAQCTWRAQPHAGCACGLLLQPQRHANDGQPARCIGLNSVGLSRAGIPEEVRRELKKAFRILYRSGLNLRQAIAEMEQELDSYEEVEHFLRFLRNADRGICRGTKD